MTAIPIPEHHPDCLACRVEALSVRCPICDAAAGQPCEDAVGGWIVREEIPHVYRIQVAMEASRSSTVEDLEAEGVAR